MPVVIWLLYEFDMKFLKPLHFCNYASVKKIWVVQCVVSFGNQCLETSPFEVSLKHAFIRSLCNVTVVLILFLWPVQFFIPSGQSLYQNDYKGSKDCIYIYINQIHRGRCVVGSPPAFIANQWNLLKL